MILGLIDRALGTVGTKAFGCLVSHANRELGHEDGEKHCDEAPIHLIRGFARMTGGRHIIGPEDREESLEGAGRAAVHYPEQIFP